jgi:hypothetical protein
MLCTFAARLINGSAVSSALPALQRRLLVDDEGSLLPRHGAGTFSGAMPNRLGRFVNSDDRQCLLLLASPEDSVELLEPSGAAPVPRVTRALQERAACPGQSSASAMHASIPRSMRARAARAKHTTRRNVTGPVPYEGGVRLARTRPRGPSRRVQPETAPPLPTARRMY